MVASDVSGAEGDIVVSEVTGAEVRDTSVAVLTCSVAEWVVFVGDGNVLLSRSS